MADVKVTISQEGLEKLQKELTECKTIIRKKIADEIDKARQQGDLSENAAYKAALENKEFNETKIKELENTINNAEIIRKSKKGVISLGSNVKLFNNNAQKEFNYSLVGEQEADSSNGKISVNSPLGEKLIGKKVGEAITISSPSGNIKYKVMAIN